jgi:hypothetical protein
MRFEWLSMDEVTPELVSRWRALGLAATTPNVYLMPEFMLPALRYLEADKTHRLAALWNADRSDLLALGIFDALPWKWRFPFSRLSAAKSKHSFQTGVLVRSGIDPVAIDRFVDGIIGGPWSALQFRELREDSVVFRQLQESALRLGLSWFVDHRYMRASLKLGDDSMWRSHIARSRHKRLQRARKKLTALGTLEFRIVSGKEVSQSTTDAFLRLEGTGWKSNSGLLANTGNAQFFAEMTHACREHGMIFFYELALNGTVIASTSNFRVNERGFAFKTGFDRTYATHCPGILAEYTFLESGAASSMRLDEIESGSWAGSFMEGLWPDRVPIVSGHFFAGKMPSVYGSVRDRLRAMGSNTMQLPTA